MAAATYKVFISHSSGDLGVARLIHDDIEGLGAHCFLDGRDLRPGMHFQAKLAEEIKSADEMIVLLSPRFAKSEWLHYEVGIALGADVPIVPVLLNLAPGEIADFTFLRHMHGIPLEDIRDYYAELRSRITSAHLNKGLMQILDSRRRITKAFERE